MFFSDCCIFYLGLFPQNSTALRPQPPGRLTKAGSILHHQAAMPYSYWRLCSVDVISGSSWGVAVVVVSFGVEEL